MQDLVIARIVHVLAIIGWIGGVWFVTLVIVPVVRRMAAPDERLRAFHRIETGFAPFARWLVLMAGASGFWITARADLWSRFADANFWWMHLMLALWAVFMLMLFVAEPLVLHARMETSTQPVADFERMAKLHSILSAIALVTVLGAVGGSHGLL